MAAPRKHYGKWRIRWVDALGERQSDVFDDYNEAKRVLAQKQSEVAEVRAGLRAPTIGKKTFDDLFDYWLKERAPHKRSQVDDESVIRAHLRPFFGKQLLSDFRVAHVDAFKRSRAHLSDKTINNILTLLITMLNMGKEDLHWLAIVPKIRKLADDRAHAFRYLRSKDEVNRFLRAAKQESELAFNLYATAIYTGMRQGELAGLSWSCVDLDRRLITVQRSFDGPTKSGKPRHVPVLDALLPILRAWRLRCPGSLVFPNERGTMHGEAARIFQETLHRILESAEFPTTEVKGKTRRYIVFHDLRHTFASHWVMNGGDLFKLQKILGHQSIEMTLRYAHLAPNAFADDYGRLGAEPTIEVGTVTPLTKAPSATN